MTLEELKAAWEAALQKLKGSPNDATLKAEADAAEKAYNDALAAEKAKEKGGKKSDEEEDGEKDPDESKWDDQTKAYIKKLRGESATHRTKNKELVSKLKVTEEQKKAILKAIGIESEDEKPEEKVKSLSADNQTLAFRNAVLEKALTHGIAADQREFFEFLITKACSDLEDGDELPEEKLLEIVKKCKAQGKKANSSVTGKEGGGEAPPPGDSNDISLDQFCRMSITEKSKLYEKSPDVYKALAAEARTKKKLV